jgi:hypothetical protein
MLLRKSTLAIFVGLLAFAAVSTPLHAQTGSCSVSQQAAVGCFVANMNTTGMARPRHGMTLAQFETYGFAVSQVLTTHHTYLIIIGTSSAIADAMPPRNENGSPNQSAQDSAVTQVVAAAVLNGMANVTSTVTLQYLQWFSLDVTDAMNENDGMMGMLTPGVSLRVIDSYIITGTSNGTVSWSVVEANLATAVDNLIGSGLAKVPQSVSVAQLKSFVIALAHTIYTYKISTGRTAL